MKPVLIEISQDRPGFNQFIGAWLCRGEKDLLVDVGPASSADRLTRSLDNMGVKTLDLILITHIHIDHAGGLARVLDHYPQARVVCHQKGIKHLVDPGKLWAGSTKTLGEVAEAYGPPGPVKEECFIPHDKAVIDRLTVIETPGHAPHHLSFVYDGYLFAGEAGGTFFSIQGHVYMRPATPPRFFQDQFLQSIQKLLNLGDLPICFAHLGLAESSRSMLTRHRDQLVRWGEIILRESREGIKNIDYYCNLLIEEDPDLAHYKLLDPPYQEREKFFLSNSIRGYLEYFEENQD